MEFSGIDIEWLGNSGFKILNVKNKSVIYVDPYNIKEGLPKADFIFITHSHYDHCSVSDISKLIKEGTRVIMNADCQSKIMKFEIPVKIDIVEPSSELDFNSLKVSVLPAYNLDKQFHTKADDFLGYLFKFEDSFIYHAGDSDLIPEIQKLTGYKKEGKNFIALLPIGGKYTMNSEEAVDAAKLLKADLVIPMHYAGISGTIEDAKEFLELCLENNINVKILEKI